MSTQQSQSNNKGSNYSSRDKKAVVLVSGGLDSATVLAMAAAQGYQCYALSMNYGQRHRVELDRAQKVAAANGAVEHRVVKIDIGGFGGSALTDQDIQSSVLEIMGTNVTTALITCPQN